MEPLIPWSRWMTGSGHPIAMQTTMGVLITGDDGNISLAFANNKAYAIEVTLKPNRLDSARSHLEKPGIGPYGVGLGKTLPHGYAASEGWSLPSAAMNSRVYSASKKGQDSEVYLRTNAIKRLNGIEQLERFEELVLHLDREAWHSTSIKLEPLAPTCNLNNTRGSFSGGDVEYKAREIKFKPRSTDRLSSERMRTYQSRMPKPFDTIMTVKHNPAWYAADWIASPGIAMLPSVANLDVSWDAPAEIGRRRKAKITSHHARENLLMKRSECAWEFDAWRDLFSTIRDDPLLTMDKHELAFLENVSLIGAGVGTPSLGKHVVRSYRIPDCTFGLAINKEPFAATDRSSKFSTLNYEDLKDLLADRHSGLISDPKWHSLSLAFPWAVYEAKKEKEVSVLTQIRLASEIYLNMLHDLCLEPGPPESSRPYQHFEDTQFQIYAMTSEGSLWKLYICYRRRVPELPLWLEDPSNVLPYDMKQIWQGDITDEKMAWQLHSLIDQIHVWAVETFRPFVLDHLKPWLLRRVSNKVEELRMKSSLSPRQPSNMYAFPAIDRDDDKAFDYSFLHPEVEALRNTARPKQESNLKPAHDNVDANPIQHEHEVDSSDLDQILASWPWWRRYAKADVTRQKLLKGQPQHSIPKAPSMKSRDNRRRRRSENAAHNHND